jgi:hypothetical protein
VSAADVPDLSTATGGKADHGTPAGRTLADTVLEAFAAHRLVGLGEAHQLQNHHDALTLLLTDPRLPGVVDDIVVEFGNALYQDTIDRFVSGQPVDNADLRLVWRNTTQSPHQTWDAPVYEQFFRTVRAVNAPLPPRRQIRVLLGDPPLDWSTVTSFHQLRAIAGAQRDAHAASVIEKQVLARGRRALICYGLGHLARGGSLAGILERGPTAGTWLGSVEAALFSPDGPASGQCGLRLESIVDAALYLGQPENLTASWPNPAIFLDPGYWTELQHRNALGNGASLSSYRQEQPVRYPLVRLPPSQECGRHLSGHPLAPGG